jgi:hypothetical protein
MAISLSIVMPECPNCGRTILEDMLFCPYCGRPVTSDDSEFFEPAKGEVVTAVAAPANVQERQGTYALVFTERRLIFARIETKAADRFKADLLQAGVFLPGSSEVANVSRFFDMDGEQVLGESEGNFSVENDDVLSVRLSYDDEHYVIDISMNEGEIRFSLPYDRYYRDLLFQAFEGRMHW